MAAIEIETLEAAIRCDLFRPGSLVKSDEMRQNLTPS
jgi:hypothetical protein